MGKRRSHKPPSVAKKDFFSLKKLINKRSRDPEESQCGLQFPSQIRFGFGFLPLQGRLQRAQVSDQPPGLHSLCACHPAKAGWVLTVHQARAGHLGAGWGALPAWSRHPRRPRGPTGVTSSLGVSNNSCGAEGRVGSAATCYLPPTQGASEGLA